MDKKTKKYLVQQSNSLIESSSQMTLVERRIIYHVLSRINPQKPQQEYELRVEDFFNDFPCMDSSSVYGQLKEGISKLFTRSVQLLTDYGSTKVFHILQEKEYKDGAGFLKMKFSDSFMPLIFELKNKYTTMILDNFKLLDSIYSLKLYELLCQYRAQGWRQDTVENLRFLLGCFDTYQEFKKFNHHVLIPAIKEIEGKTDLLVQIETIRTGRSVTSIRFLIAEKSDALQVKEIEKQKAIKLPNPPSMRRHPNPKVFFQQMKEWNEEEMEANQFNFSVAEFKWASENIYRINKHEFILKNCDSKLELPPKFIEGKKKYIKKIADLYNFYSKDEIAISIFDNIRKDYSKKEERFGNTKTTRKPS